MRAMKWRDVVLHDDGSLSYTVHFGSGECRVTIGSPRRGYEPVFPEQADWLRRRRGEPATFAGDDDRD